MAATFPQKFGKYTLLRKLATGGMAELFVAKTMGAEGFERELVIKRILPSFSEDEAFVKMFIDEASLTSKLQHPNIVQIFDFDVTDRQYYIAMEFIEGEDLQNIVKTGTEAKRPLSVAQCVWIIIELAKGLHYAHTKEHKGRPLNIIHRDISPHNAMVSYDGEVKLMDFGIAKAAERSTKTQAGTVKGKVAYMSPEQARGKVLDPRSDMFALAAVAWELLTGKRLFLRGSDFETLTAVLKEDPDPPSKSRKGIDQELDDIIMTALDKDRENRQASVEVLARELTRWYYKNVTDLEKENLGTYMRETFASKIESLPKPDPQDLATVKATPQQLAAPVSRSNKSAPVPLPEPAPRPSPRRATGQVNAPSDDGKPLARTVEASVPELLRAAAPARARGRTMDQLPHASPPSASPEEFANSATILEEGGPSQAELMRALAEAQKKRTGANPQLDVPERGADKGKKSGLTKVPQKKSNALLWVIVTSVIVAGGAVAAVFALK